MKLAQHRDRLSALLLGLADLLWLVAGYLVFSRISGLNFSGQSTPYLVALALIQIFFLTLSGAYRLPRKWGISEAGPVVLRAALPMIVILFLFWGWLIVNDQSEFLFMIQLLVFYLLFVLPGLVYVRLLAGRSQILLFRKGIGLRRSLILGDGKRAEYLRERIARSDWLGERIVHQNKGIRQKVVSDEIDRLTELIRVQDVDVVWLTNDILDPTIDQLMSLITSNHRRHVIWRILPEDLRILTERLNTRLNFSERQKLSKSLEYKFSLPEVSVAILGSRGVPANYSGIERYIEEIGSYLAGSGEHFVVYCHRRFISRRGSYKGMELRFVPTVPSKNLETIVHTILSTLHVLVREEEIIHYQALGPSTLAWLPRFFGRKVIVSIQGLDWQRAKWGRLARIYLKIGEWASAHFPHITIVVSKTLFDYYREKYPGTNLVYIPNGFIVPEYRQSSHVNQFGVEKDNYILFVGRLEPEKGCHLLIEAFGKIRTNQHLVIAGRENHGTAYRQELEVAAAELDNVHFTGFVEGETLAALYSNAYLVVLPSDIEGMSLVLLEALSHGNCVLVSDIRENQEAVQDMGLTFQNGNRYDLSQKLQYLCDNPQQIEAKRAQTRKLNAIHMAWDEIALATLENYKRLTNGK